MRKVCQRLSASALVCFVLFAPMVLASESASAFSIKPNVRVDWEASHIEPPGTSGFNGSEFRRFNAGVVGKVGTLKYKAIADLSGLQHRFSRDVLKMRDLWVSQRLGSGTLKVGQFKPAFALDGTSGSDISSFIERASGPAVLHPGFRKAVSWEMGSERGSLAVLAWRLQKIGAPELAGFGVGTRMTFAPFAKAGDVRHLGVSLAHERHDHPGANGMPALRIRALTGAHLSKSVRPTLTLFSAGRATDMDKWSLEYAQGHGAWSWQGEFSGALIEDGLEQAHLVAGYGALSWFVSGHARNYRAASGRFERIRDVTPSAPGWELALRVDHLHGHQRGASGIDHSTMAWTLASNWYLHPNFRLLLNFVRNSDHNHLTHARGRTHELIGRVQYDF